MKKLRDFKGEEALDVLADILEPSAEIMTDKEVAFLARAGNRLGAVKLAIKNHKKAVIKILAILEGEDPLTYEPLLLTIPLKLLELFNDPDVVQVFTLQGQETEQESSGSAMANTTETEEE